MNTNNLFNSVLLYPASKYDELRIISGYATSAMAFKHLCQLAELKLDIRINLVVGMTPFDGISMGNHNGFVKIMNSIFPEKFKCSYLLNPPPVHSKLYVWLKDSNPALGFAGSANYTQTAFDEMRQREVLVECDPDEALTYFDSIECQSIFCNHPDVDTNVLILKEQEYLAGRVRKRLKNKKKANVNDYREIGLDRIEVSLLSKNGEIQRTAGLNWGQRAGRDHNQAYIQLPPSVYKSSFFPVRGTHFTIITDDNKTLICSRAQKNDLGAAIHTPHNNSLLGEYFRQRLGLKAGAFVETKDLTRYGRTSVTFYKIDDENFYMDFSN